jgi:lipopolysaccharide/colanic/teichoic acid biosynthesis glycosyltransferase
VGRWRRFEGVRTTDVRLLLIEGLWALLSLALAVVLRLGVAGAPVYLFRQAPQIAVVSLVYGVVLYAVGSQISRIRRDVALVLVTHVSANAIAWLVALSLVYFQGLDRIGRGILILFGLINLVVSGVWRLVGHQFAAHFVAPRRALILGTGDAGQAIAELLLNSSAGSIQPVGFVLGSDGKNEGGRVDLPVYVGAATLSQVAAEANATCIVLAPPYRRDEDLVMELIRCRVRGVEILDGLHVYETLTGRVPLAFNQDHWGLFLSLNQIRLMNPRVKRLVDLTLGSLLFVLTAPLMLCVAALVKMGSKGPVFYRQERLGQHGRVFKVVKFRTMVPDAEAGTGPVWASEDDPRTTSIGRFLRKWRLDELPQLINVLQGEMSLVGPRPEREVFVAGFLQRIPIMRSGKRKTDPDGTYFVDGFRETISLYSTRLLVKPGVTGWAQVNFRYAASLEDSREKFEYDLYYIKNQGFLLDLAILLRTAFVAGMPSGR